MKKEEKKEKTTKIKKIDKNIDINGEEEVKIPKKVQKALKEANFEPKTANNDEITTNVTFNLLEVIIIILITGVVVSIISGLIIYNNYSSNKEENNTVSSSELNELEEHYNRIINEYVEEVDKKELLDAAISGMYNYLGDEYSTYLTESETDTLSDQMQGEYEGVGIEIATYYGTDSENNTKSIILVHDVFKDSPADKAGVKQGDIITKVNDIDLSDKDSSYLADYIKNGELTSFTLTIMREEKEITVNVNREHVYIDSVNYKVDDNVGYIQIETFSSTTATQVKKAIDSFDSKVKSVVIDLRDNTGGLLNSAYDTASVFVDNGQIVYKIKDRNEIVSDYKSVSQAYRKFDKIVVLINGNSASASEILTLALKDDCNATIVGTKSYGKGTVQETKNLDSGAMVKFTTGYWLGPNGESINKEGITPDKVVEDTDSQYKEALKLAK